MMMCACICRPHKRLGISVALIQVVEHRLLQGPHGRVTSAGDASFGHFGNNRSTRFNQLPLVGCSEGDSEGGAPTIFAPG